MLGCGLGSAAARAALIRQQQQQEKEPHQHTQLSNDATLHLPSATAMDTQPETTPREDRLTEADLLAMLPSVQDAERARLYATAQQAEHDALGDEPYVYRSRRAVQVGAGRLVSQTVL